jgi:MFS family permease
VTFGIEIGLYKTVRTFYYAVAVKKTAVGALVAGELVSILGTRMTYLALPWFVLVTTGSASKMTLVLAVEILPMALFGIPSGSLVHRLGSRTVMLISDFARAPLLASVPLLHAAGVLSFPLLLGVVFALGCFMPPYFASQRTILPELVGEDERMMSQANSLIEGGGAIAALLGPALAGVLIPVIGAPNVLYVDAATYVISFLLILIFVPRREPVGEEPQHGVLGGISFLLRDRLLGPMALVVVAFGFLGSGLSAALPFYAYDEFDGSSRIAGLFYTALGAGAVVGSLIAVVAVRKVPPLKLAALAIVGFAAPMWLLPLGLPFGAVFVVLLVASAFTPLVNAPLIATMTARTPPELRAKVLTAAISVNTIAAPLGFLAAGQVLERWGVNPVFAGVAAGVSIAALGFSAVVLRYAGEGLSVTAEASTSSA